MPVSDSIGVPAALAAGVLSFLSPCVLPLVPAYLSYISGMSVEDLAKARPVEAAGRTGLRALLFVLGFSAVFVAMGATATSIGQALSTRTDTLMRVAGAVIFVFGLHLLGAIRIRALYGEKRFRIRVSGVGLAGAFLMGTAFAFGWTPCIGPVLMGILTLAADSATLPRGMLLLGSYSLGLGLPFLIAGLGAGSVLSALSRFKKHFRKVEVASGALMMGVGLLVLTGNLQRVTTITESLLSRIM